jgi:hypothetical protein
LFLARKTCPTKVPNPVLVSPGAIVSPFTSEQEKDIQYVVIGNEFLFLIAHESDLSEYGEHASEDGFKDWLKTRGIIARR